MDTKEERLARLAVLPRTSSTAGLAQMVEQWLCNPQEKVRFLHSATVKYTIGLDYDISIPNATFVCISLDRGIDETCCSIRLSPLAA